MGNNSISIFASKGGVPSLGSLHSQHERPPEQPLDVAGSLPEHLVKRKPLGLFVSRGQKEQHVEHRHQSVDKFSGNLDH
eukprot:6216397-Amphidinium_carterae.1